MIDPSDFTAQFASEPVPAALLRLLEYQNVVGYGRYSQALTLSVGEQSGLVHGWSSDPDFLAKLVPFGMANASGSFYALWNNGADSKIEQWPVVAFGDEGGEWVIARNLRDLFRLSTFDAEPMIDYHGIEFFKDPDWYEVSEFLDEYQIWLKAEFDIDPVADPAALVSEAQTELQESFNAWKQRYLTHKAV